MDNLFNSSRAFAPFYDTPVAFRGIRPGTRPVAFVVNCCIIEDSPDIQADGAAPSRCRVFNISFPFAAWTDETPPHISEKVEFEWHGSPIRAALKSVSHFPDGDYSLVAEADEKAAAKCRARGGAQ